MQVSKVILKDGRSLDSTLVVVGVGARPLLAPFKGLLEEENGGFKVCVSVKTFYCAGTLILHVSLHLRTQIVGVLVCLGMQGPAKIRRVRCIWWDCN